ncbi:MAG: YjfB family protein [Phycisphaerales bacterium]|nr:MAG: YjfB family protein [Phycisphaerales bacterium]
MDVTSLASALTDLKAAELRQQVAISVLAKTMDAGRQNGQAVVALIEAAAEVQTATQDAAAAIEGLGEMLDVSA